MRSVVDSSLSTTRAAVCRVRRRIARDGAPFPNTPLYDRLKKKGRLTHDGQWDRCTLFDINYDPTPMSVAQLRRGFHELSERLYSESFTAWRRERFRAQSREGERYRRHATKLERGRLPISLPVSA